MNGLFASAGEITGVNAPPSQAEQTTAVAGVKFQTSCYGGVIPLVWGTDRLPVNIIGYGNFQAQTHISPGATSQPNGGGGKGGASTGVSPGAQGTTFYVYFIGIMAAVCEGPIRAFGAAWNGKSRKTGPTNLGYTTFFGGYPQAPFPARIRLDPAMGTDGMGGYNGLAYLAAASLALGTSSTLPNTNVEVFGRLTTSTDTDVEPGAIVSDIITDPKCGLGLPLSVAGSLTTVNAYTAATGLKFSFTLLEQRPAADLITEILTFANTDVTFSEGILKYIPRGDAAAGAYVPPSVVFDFTEDDLLPMEKDGDPIRTDRKDPADLFTRITLEILDRTKDYTPAVVRSSDDALFAQYGARPADSRSCAMVKLPTIGATVAQLLLQRQGIMNEYTFKVGPQWVVVLDPGDIVTLTYPALGLAAQPVKIKSYDTDDDGMVIVAEEYGVGMGTAADSGSTPGSGGGINYDVSPGSVTATSVFEPPAGFTSDQLQVMLAAAGTDPNYGGCEIHFSVDGTQYDYLARIDGSCRIGELSGNAAGGQYPMFESVGPNVDSTSYPIVDFSTSNASLSSVTSDERDALVTATWVFNDPSDIGTGEIFAYQSALLVAGAPTPRYKLKELLRGQFGTTGNRHLVGCKVVRLDPSVPRWPFTPDKIGMTIQLKFLAFNKYGNALQELADVVAVPYTILGTAYSAPEEVPVGVQQSDVQNLYALVGGLQITIAQLLNKQVMIEANGNYYADSFKTSTGLDLTLSFGMNLDRNIPAIYPANEPAGLISRSLGTIIGNFSSNPGAAFDGIRGGALGANPAAVRGLVANSGNASWIGKDYGIAPKKIAKIMLYGTTDSGFGAQPSPFGLPATQQNFRAWAIPAGDPAPTGPESGQPISNVLAVPTPASPKTALSIPKYSTAAGFTITSLNQNVAYRYVMATMGFIGGAGTVNNNSFYVTEMEIYEAATPINMVAVSTIYIPAQAVSTVMFQTVLELIEPLELNTDLIIEIAADAQIKTITAATKANPCVLTIPNHGFANGRALYVGGALGMTQLNGRDFIVAGVTTNTLQLQGVDSTGYGTYTASSAKALVASWTKMFMTDITGPAGGAFRALQSVIQSFSVPGKAVVWRARSINSKFYKLRGAATFWK